MKSEALHRVLKNKKASHLSSILTFYVPCFSSQAALAAEDQTVVRRVDGGRYLGQCGVSSVDIRHHVACRITE